MRIASICWRHSVELRDVLRLFHPRRGQLASLIVLGVAASLAEAVGISLFIPLLHSSFDPHANADRGWLINTLLSLSTLLPAGHRTWGLSIGILTAVAVRCIVGYASSYLFRRFDAESSHRLRFELYDRLLLMPFRDFEREDHGRLLNVVSNETWKASEALSAFARVLITTSTLLVYLLLLLLLSWQLTIVVAAAVAGILLVVRLLTVGFVEMSREITAASSALARRTMESVQGMALIRSAGRAPSERIQFQSDSRRISDLIERVMHRGDVIAPLYEFMAAAMLVGILAAGTAAMHSTSAAIVFAFLVYRVQPQAMQLNQALATISSLSGATSEVGRLLSIPIESLTWGNAPVEELHDTIRIRDVSFAYQPGCMILRNVRCTIPAHQITAIVGSSGAGKSTLLKLLAALYPPDVGQIEFDGVDVRRFCERSYRQAVALLPQDCLLFDGTIRENIAFRFPTANMSQIETATRRADADGFINGLPQGFDTPVGALGSHLSGGQKQRIALARALLGEPQLLLLDEPTNALDEGSEQQLRAALEKYRERGTIVIATHDTSIIQSADCVIELENGSVVRVRRRGHWDATEPEFASTLPHDI